MPLARVEVRNEYGYGAPEIYSEANREEPKEILEGVAIAGLIGVLRQLGDLTDFAAEVFHGLQEELMMTSSRSRNLLGRVRRIEAAFSPLEKAARAQRSHLHFVYVPGFNWHSRINCEKNKFVYTDVPQFILDSYEDCSEPPRLHLLDRFDPSGPGSCFKRYSDPSFCKNASAQKHLEDKKESKINKLRSWPRNGGVSPGTSFSNPGVSHGATLRSDLSEQLTLDLRNASNSSEGDFRLSYSVQALEKEDDHHTCVESFSTKLNLEAPGDNSVKSEAVGKTSFKICDIDPKSEYIDICFDEFENAKYTFMDSPNAIVLEDKTDLTSLKIQDSRLKGEVAEFREQNLQRQTSYSESNGSFMTGGCEHNPDAVSLRSPFAAFCCDSCISAKDLCNSVSPLDKSLISHSIGSYGHGSDTDGTNTEYIRDKRSGLPQKPAPETSYGTTPVFVWTNGGLLGLQPSKPPDCGLGDAHGKPDKMKSFRRYEGSLNTNSSTYQENGESNSWFRKIQCKISPVNLGLKLIKNDASLTQAGNVLPLAARKHAEDSRGSSNIFKLGNRLLTFKQNDSKYQAKRELSISSPSSSPRLRHMKISFQPIDGFKTLKLKLKFPCQVTGDGSCSDIFPSFQLVPELSSAQQRGGSDSSDDDTFYRSSASSLDGCCCDHESESNSEQCESDEFPANNDPDLCNFLSKISCLESISTVMENGRSSHSNENYLQSFHPHSRRSLDSQSLKAINNSFRYETRHDDNLVESEFATAPDPSSIPPVQWHDIKRNSDYAFNLKDSPSTISQQPKPAPFDNHIATIEQKRVDSKGQREANKGKSTDEDFLQLIRSKSLNLRPTVTTKTSTPSASPPNVHVTAILKKANSIRQAVGSDDAEDGDWSDI